MTNVCMVHFTWKDNDYLKKREINPSFFIESVYLFLYSLSFFKDIVLLGKLNCQSVPCIDHACWILLSVLSPVEVSIPR